MGDFFLLLYTFQEKFYKHASLGNQKKILSKKFLKASFLMLLTLLPLEVYPPELPPGNAGPICGIQPGATLSLGSQLRGRGSSPPPLIPMLLDLIPTRSAAAGLRCPHRLQSTRNSPESSGLPYGTGALTWKRPGGGAVSICPPGARARARTRPGVGRPLSEGLLTTSGNTESSY